MWRGQTRLSAVETYGRIAHVIRRRSAHLWRMTTHPSAWTMEFSEVRSSIPDTRTYASCTFVSLVVEKHPSRKGGRSQKAYAHDHSGGQGALASHYRRGY